MSKAKIDYIPYNKGKRKKISDRKVCRVCNIEKNISDFTKQGYWGRNMCKKCRNERLTKKRTSVSGNLTLV